MPTGHLLALEEGSQAPLAGDQIHGGRLGDVKAAAVKAESCGRPEAGLDPASSRARGVSDTRADGFPGPTTPRRPLPSRKGPSTCALTSVPPSRYERVHILASSMRTSPWRSERLVTATVVAPSNRRSRHRLGACALGGAWVWTRCTGPSPPTWVTGSTGGQGGLDARRAAGNAHGAELSGKLLVSGGGARAVFGPRDSPKTALGRTGRGSPKGLQSCSGLGCGLPPAGEGRRFQLRHRSARARSSRHRGAVEWLRATP